MTLDDIERASKIYGANIAALKGKTVRTKSEPVISDYIAVPENVLQANRNVTFSADIMFVNKIPFFTTVSRDIKFTTVEGIEKRTLHDALPIYMRCMKVVAPRVIGRKPQKGACSSWCSQTSHQLLGCVG